MHLSQIKQNDLELVGSKALYLSKLFYILEDINASVPETYVLPSTFYLNFINGEITNVINESMNKIEASNYETTVVCKYSEIIRNEIMNTSLSNETLEYIEKIYNELMSSTTCLAVRSSSSSEDLDDYSFAGQYDSFLNVSSLEAVIESVKLIYASLYSERAIKYRSKINLDKVLTMPVVIQEMIVNDNGSSGVLFTDDIDDDYTNSMLITSTYGMCEMIVSGKVTPDEYIVSKNNFEVLEKELGFKDHIMTKEFGIIETPLNKKEEYSLSDALLRLVSETALHIDIAFSKRMDIEWVINDHGDLYIVQSRPLT